VNAVTLHSPLPWKIVRSAVPYFTWLCDAEGGCVAIGFGYHDEALLLRAPALLHAIEAAVVAFDAGRIGTARRILTEALAEE
jgi:hypothetical protein